MFKLVSFSAFENYTIVYVCAILSLMYNTTEINQQQVGMECLSAIKIFTSLQNLDAGDITSQYTLLYTYLMK